MEFISTRFKCPFCKKPNIYIGVHDSEGNFKGNLGCEYEKQPWSGLSYGLHHEGWGDCIMCTDDDEMVMGGVLFDTAEEATESLMGVADSKRSTWQYSLLDGTFRCPSCGSVVHERRDIFDLEANDESNLNFCPNCGRWLD